MAQPFLKPTQNIVDPLSALNNRQPTTKQYHIWYGLQMKSAFCPKISGNSPSNNRQQSATIGNASERRYWCAVPSCGAAHVLRSRACVEDNKKTSRSSVLREGSSSWQATNHPCSTMLQGINIIYLLYPNTRDPCWDP
jgi:hypothetical protein